MQQHEDEGSKEATRNDTTHNAHSEPTRWANAKQLSSALQAKLCQSTNQSIEVESELKALEAFFAFTIEIVQRERDREQESVRVQERV